MALPGNILSVPQPGLIAGSVSLEGLKPTYRAAKQALALASTPTLVATLVGSATRTVKVIGLRLSGAAATASQDLPFVVNKYSAAHSGGTATQPAVIPCDSTNPAGTAVANVYTANPTVGTSLGPVATGVVSCGLATVAGGSPVVDVPLVNAFGQAITLRGVAQSIGIELGGVALANATTANVEIIWTEE